MTIALETLGARSLRWTLAVAVVAAVHGAAIAWALRIPPEDDWDSQTGGAFIIELSPITASPDEHRRDIAVGQKSQEVAPVAASAPQTSAMAEPTPEDLPPLPDSIEPPPEDAVARRQDEKPPEQVPPPEISASQAKDAPAAAQVVASEAAAPQQIENATEISEVPRGQHSGLSRVDRQAIENWQRDVVVQINRHKRYPLPAREARQHGVVRVIFAMDRDGRVVRSSVVNGSGFVSLDRAAIEILERASPLPVPPASMPGETIEYVVPLKFRWTE